MSIQNHTIPVFFFFLLLLTLRIWCLQCFSFSMLNCLWRTRSHSIQLKQFAICLHRYNTYSVHSFFLLLFRFLFFFCWLFFRCLRLNNSATEFPISKLPLCYRWMHAFYGEINAQILYSPGCLFAILLKQFWKTS